MIFQLGHVPGPVVCEVAETWQAIEDNAATGRGRGGPLNPTTYLLHGPATHWVPNAVTRQSSKPLR